jgi:hypothetical protein
MTVGLLSEIKSPQAGFLGPTRGHNISRMAAVDEGSQNCPVFELKGCEEIGIGLSFAHRGRGAGVAIREQHDAASPCVPRFAVTEQEKLLGDNHCK